MIEIVTLKQIMVRYFFETYEVLKLKQIKKLPPTTLTFIDQC